MDWRNFNGVLNEDDHRRLAEDFANLPCKALMVIGKTDLTVQLYKGYIVDEYEKNYAVNIRNRFKATAKHIVVANYRYTPNPEQVLHFFEHSEKMAQECDNEVLWFENMKSSAMDWLNI